MRATLFFCLIIAQLVWWDLLDKVRIAVSTSHARRVMNRYVPLRARRLFAIARRFAGLRLQIDLDDRDYPDRFVILANHQSVIDIVAIMAAFRHHSVRFVAKRELGKWFPAVSRVLRVQRHALINRSGDVAQAMHEIERLGRDLGPGEAIVIFPEGTRSRDGRVHTFHSGALRRLLRARSLPLVIVALDGGWRLSRLSDLTQMRTGHRYRIKGVTIMDAAHDKRALLESVAHARELIDDTIAGWRSTGE